MSLHRSIQNYIIRALPKGEAYIEYRLNNHVADVLWLREKIVFEVQCSLISFEEMTKRYNDYESMGFILVWILHTKSYNKKYVTRAERYMRTKTCYYTNLSVFGRGIIFDQFEMIQNNQRKMRSPPLRVDLSLPLSKSGNKISFIGDRSCYPNGFESAFPREKVSFIDKAIDLYDKFFVKCLERFSFLP